MNDWEYGKRLAEEMVLEQLLRSFPKITGRILTDEAEGDFAPIDLAPDFVIGLDGKAIGIELTEIRHAEEAWDYLEEASRLAWQKHASYEKRGLFQHPIALIFHAYGPPLFEVRRQLEHFGPGDFEDLGFTEVWGVDFSNAYYSAGHPLRPADMFCFKPAEWFGFHRIGWGDRKPYG
jgi:hypothetical protein